MLLLFGFCNGWLKSIDNKSLAVTSFLTFLDFSEDDDDYYYYYGDELIF